MNVVFIVLIIQQETYPAMIKFSFCLTPRTTTEDNDMSTSPTPDGVLKPTLSVFDVVAITVSAVTPAVPYL